MMAQVDPSALTFRVKAALFGRKPALWDWAGALAALGVVLAAAGPIEAGSPPPVEYELFDTTTVVTSPMNPWSWDMGDITFTADVSSEAGGPAIPTGTVTFRAADTVLGAAALTDGQASLTTDALGIGLGIGVHSITATYEGDDSFAGSTSTALEQTIAPSILDLVVSKTDGETVVTPGETVVYTIEVSNVGPGPIAPGALVQDVPPAVLTGVSWMCVASGGSSCTSSGTGAIGDVVNVVQGGSITYTLTGTVSEGATGDLLNTATVTPPPGLVVDIEPPNNSSTDSDTILPLPELSVTDAAPVPEGDGEARQLEFTVTLSEPSTQTVIVSFHTMDGTAEAGVDYTSVSGDLTFAPDVTSQTIRVDVLGDNLPEADETVLVGLTSPSWATLVQDGATGLIEDDDSSTGDLDGDGRSDVLWRGSDGLVRGWLMNGTTVDSAADLPARAASWVVEDVADFDADGCADVLWRDGATGGTEVWLMNGLSSPSSGATSAQNDMSWRLEATGDLDGNGTDDVIWRHRLGTRNVWFMSGTAVSSSSDLPSGPVEARILGTADFDGDGADDILWRSREAGLHMWVMNGATVLEEAAVAFGAIPLAGQVRGLGDLDGDGKADVLWRDALGRALAWFMNATTVASSAMLPRLTRDQSIAGLGDFDGDGSDDILLVDRATGVTSLWLMQGSTVKDSGPTSLQEEASWSIVAPVRMGTPGPRQGATRRVR